jgi:mono/diheme cytochrome c family protein
MKNTFWAGALLFTAFAGACSRENKEALTATPTNPGCDTTNVTYKLTIQPLTNQYCAVAGCHTTDARASGYDLSSYADMKRTADAGSLLGSIRHDSKYSPMPRGTTDKLSDCEIAKYAKWVAAGAPNN